MCNSFKFAAQLRGNLHEALSSETLTEMSTLSTFSLQQSFLKVEFCSLNVCGFHLNERT